MLISIVDDVKVRIPFNKQGFELSFNSGDLRKTYQFENARLVAYLLSLNKTPGESVVSQLNEILDTDSDDSQNVLQEFLNGGILYSGVSAVSELAAKWESNGWRDALDFHLATQDLSFNKDSSAYVSAMREQIRAGEIDKDEESPPPFKDYEGERIELIDLPPASKDVFNIDFQSLIRKSLPFQTYGKGVLNVGQVSDILYNTYAARSQHVGLPGPYFKRTSPSGGARHPIECYVLVNDVDGLEPGIYHYSSKDHKLEYLEKGDFKDRLTEICFQKPGIETASAVCILTARWFRHMWKYRYARSYRMMHYDVGHLLQTHLLNAISVNVQSFLCPSFHDDKSNELLGLGSNFDEDVIYMIGMGLKNNDEAVQYFFPEHKY